MICETFFCSLIREKLESAPQSFSKPWPENEPHPTWSCTTRATQPSSTAGSSLTAYLACYHKQRAPASISTARLVHRQTHSHSCRHAAFPSRNVCHPITVPFKQYSVLPFYFASSLIQGVILPGDTRRIDFIFKSEKPGIKTELWQLNTHPVLMQGASLQVTLRGLAVFEDQTAHQRLFIEVSYR